MSESQIVVTLPHCWNAIAALNARDFAKARLEAGEIMEDLPSGEEGVGLRVCALHLMAEVHNQQGRYWVDAGQHQKALALIHEARMALDTDRSWRYWQNQIQEAQTHILMGDYDKAWEVLEYCSGFARRASSAVPHRERLLLQWAYSLYHYARNNYDAAEDWIREVLEGLRQGDDAQLELKVYTQAVRVAIKRNDTEAIQNYAPLLRKLATEQKNVESQFVSMNAAAICSVLEGDFKTAMLHSRNALDLATSIGYPYGVANSMVNIATIYACLLNYNKALEYYNLALEGYGDGVLGDNVRLVVLANIGNMHLTLGEAKKALDYFQRCLLLEDSVGYKELRGQAMAQMGQALLDLGRTDEALARALDAEQLLTECGNRLSQLNALITLGNIYHERGETEKAIGYVSLGLDLARESNDSKAEMRGYQLFSQIFQRQKKYKKALEYQCLYNEAQENYTRRQRERQITDVEIHYHLQKKEEEMQLLRNHQAEMAEHKKRIEEQNQQLKEANGDLTQFAYAVSHDLKEPLRMIGSYVQLLERRKSHCFDEEAKEFFGYVSEGAARMGRLLDDMLQYATIGRKGELDLSVVKLGEVLEATLFNLKLAIADAKAKVTSEGLRPIISNHSFIMQLFQNLISNAVKFAREGVPPEIHVSYEKEKEEHVLRFADNGIGIAEKDRKRIFMIFQRLHRRKDFEGSGIGLSICMKIVQRLGGTISVDSEYGKGTTFTIRLPYAQPTAT